jgi:hypothetical protein
MGIGGPRHLKSLLLASLAIVVLSGCGKTSGGGASGPSAVNPREYVDQPNLAQVGVDPALHASLVGFLAPADDTFQADNGTTSVAILDGTVDVTHPDLAGRTTVLNVYSSAPLAPENHGTHVAGIIGANLDGAGIVGVNPYVGLLNIPVFAGRRWIANDHAQAALEAAVAEGAVVANMSYSAGGAGQIFRPGELDVIAGFGDSLVVVRAAGNDGVNARDAPYDGTAAIDLGHLLIVGSVNANGTIHTNSNRPGNACLSTSSDCNASDPAAMMNYFLVAPGVSVISTFAGGQYGSLTGTSMAAPHVAGAAALVYQQALAGNTLLSPTEIASILKQSATDLGASGVDPVYGWGLLNVPAALSPVGNLYLATAETVDSGLQPMSESTFSSSSVVQDSSGVESVLSGMVLMDEFKRPFALDEIQMNRQPSYLLERSVDQLLAAVAEEPREIAAQGTFSMQLVASGDAARWDGYRALSLTSDSVALQAGFGTVASYFAAGASDRAMKSGSHALGTDFFAASGNITKGLSNAIFAGADYSFSDELSFSGLVLRSAPHTWANDDYVHEVLEFEDRDPSSLVKLGLRYRFDDWISLGASYGMLYEEGRVLGMETSGGLALGQSALTQLFGASIRAQLTQTVSLTVFAESSLTSSALDDSSLFSEVENWRASKLGLSLEWQSLMAAKDTFRLTAAKPWTLDSAKVSARVPVGRELDGTVNYEHRTASVAGADYPLELSLSYQNRLNRLSYGAGLTMFSQDLRAELVTELAVTGALQWKF